MKNLFTLGLMVFFVAACEIPISTVEEPTAQLPFATLTPLVAANLPLQEKQAEVDALNGNVEDLNAQVALLESQIADLQAKIEQFQADATQAAITPTATIRPTSAATSVPSYVITVTANQKLNLRYYKKTNLAGNPIMLIYEPRVQYFAGDTFQIIKFPIQVDGGGSYYEVIGPRGAGLYVRGSDIDF